MEKKVYELSVNEVFKTVAPPLTESEIENLREDIIRHGCLVPIITWNGTIVDGHNRYSICRENRIPFAVIEIEFEDESDAKLWIVKNQLGRRNLTKYQRCEMVLPMEEKIKAETEKKRRALISEYRQRGETMPKSAESDTTRDVLARMAGVGHSMLDMVKLIVELADEETKEKLRHDELKINAVFKTLKRKPKENPDDGGAKETEFDEPEIHVEKPTVFDNTPELDDKDEVFSPEDFGEVETQVEICIQDFMMNFRQTMKWIGQNHLSGKNEAAVKALLKEGYEAAVETLRGRFEELRGENK